MFGSPGGRSPWSCRMPLNWSGSSQPRKRTLHMHPPGGPVLAYRMIRLWGSSESFPKMGFAEAQEPASCRPTYPVGPDPWAHAGSPRSRSAIRSFRGRPSGVKTGVGGQVGRRGVKGGGKRGRTRSANTIPVSEHLVLPDRQISPIRNILCISPILAPKDEGPSSSAAEPLPAAPDKPNSFVALVDTGDRGRKSGPGGWRSTGQVRGSEDSSRQRPRSPPLRGSPISWSMHQSVSRVA